MPDIPRDQWAAQPNYPTNAGLLRAHDSFRDISANLVEKSRSAGTREFQTLMFLFLRWKSAMKNHETYEEKKLYPYLAARHGVSFEVLEQQHKRLAEKERIAVSAWGEDDPQGIADALAEHDLILLNHLAEEEDLVMPMVLGLSPQAYARIS